VTGIIQGPGSRLDHALFTSTTTIITNFGVSETVGWHRALLVGRDMMSGLQLTSALLHLQTIRWFFMSLCVRPHVRINNSTSELRSCTTLRFTNYACIRLLLGLWLCASHRKNCRRSFMRTALKEKGNGLCNKEVEEIVRLKLLVFGVPWNQRRKLFSLFITSIYI
jgi:hypothetical protein